MGSAFGHARVRYAVNRPIVIGVTGGIATGKSSVLAMLAQRGADTIDADAVYHEMIGPGGPLVEAIVERFGPDVVADDGSIDRRALAGIVFADRSALADLDQITHPAVIQEVGERIAASDAQVVAVDAVKLIESGMADECDSVWLVVCDPAIQRERLMRRNTLTGDEADLRLAAQPDEAARRLRADTVIDNSGTLHDLERQVDNRWQLVK
jgi:dephospho-CoA kinase